MTAIQSLTIKNFRGIGSGVLPGFGPLTILVGRNGSGKSTVLDALLVAANPNPALGLIQAAQRRFNAPNPGARLLPFARRDLLPTSAEICVRDSAQQERRLSISSTTASRRLRESFANEYEEIADPMTVLQIAPQAPEGTAGEPNPLLLGPARVGVVGFDYLGRSRVFIEAEAPPQLMTAVRVLDADYGEAGRTVARTYSSIVESGAAQQVVDVVKEIVPGTVGVQVLVDEASQSTLYIEFSGGRGAIPLMIAGEGTKRAILLAIELSAMPADGLALVEEPELHLHPGTMVHMAKAVWGAVDRGVQTVVTTHSLEFIDALLDARPHDDLKSAVIMRLRLESGALTSDAMDGTRRRTAMFDVRDDLWSD